MTLFASPSAAEAAAERLKAYAQPRRLMIMSRLLDAEYAVGEIEESTGIGQPALSQQLAELRRAGLVKTRRASKQIYYSLADENVATCIRGIEAMFGTEANVASAFGKIATAKASRPGLSQPIGAATFPRIGS